MSLRKWRAAVTILIRTVGFFLVLWYSMRLALFVVETSQIMPIQQRGVVSWFRQWYLHFLVGLIPLPLGAYLFFSGKWFVDRILRGLARGCANCGYDTSGIRGSVCPECGVELYSK